MPDHDPRTTNINVTTTPSGGGLYLLVGALVVAALVGAFFLFGAPGLNTNIARAPDRDITVTVGQPSAPAQPAPRQ
jgi:hypothetical protein